MAEKTLIAALVHVHCLAHSGYRRAGMAFNHGENTLQPSDITTAQLAQLKADPRLKVTVADESKETPTSDTISDANLPNLASSDGSQGESVDAGDPSTSLEEGEEPPAKPETLVDAIKLLDPSNAEHFTGSGKPQVEALSELLGKKVTATERDEAWQFVQDDHISSVEG